MNTLDNPTLSTNGADTIARAAMRGHDLLNLLGCEVRVVSNAMTEWQTDRTGILWNVQGCISNLGETGFLGVILMLKTDAGGYRVVFLHKGDLVQSYCKHHDIYGCPFAH